MILNLTHQMLEEEYPQFPAELIPHAKILLDSCNSLGYDIIFDTQEQTIRFISQHQNSTEAIPISAEAMNALVGTWTLIALDTHESAMQHDLTLEHLRQLADKVGGAIWEDWRVENAYVYFRPNRPRNLFIIRNAHDPKRERVSSGGRYWVFQKDELEELHSFLLHDQELLQQYKKAKLS